MEGGTLVDFTFCPCSTPVTVNNPMDIGKTNTSAFEILLAVQALKDPKELVCVRHIETHTIVANKYNYFGFMLLETDLDLCDRSGAGELQRIGDQIHQYDAEHGSVSSYRRQG
jgi:hypothetical protein